MKGSVSVSLLRGLGLCRASNPTIECTFGYGSGIFHQAGYDKNRSSSAMQDYIIVVSDPIAFHADNLVRNGKHYSALMRILGPRAVSVVQSWGAGVYYNTCYQNEGPSFKYGVVAADVLERDLRHWDTLYVAGRLHKPVRFEDAPDKGSSLHTALQLNLQTALHTALLLLPPSPASTTRISETDLFRSICALSYYGDVRMGVAENPHKVDNIVRPNLHAFAQLYAPVVAASPFISSSSSPMANVFEFAPLPNTHKKLLDHLPSTLQDNLEKRCETKHVYSSIFCGDSGGDARRIVQETLSEIVKESSMAQSFKGLLSAGPVTAIRYVRAKLAKRRTS